MKYIPGKVPADYKLIPEFLQAELARMERFFAGKRDVVKFEILHAVPAKFEEGDVVYADGTDWNPGSGAGLYKRSSAAWVAL